MAKFHLTQYTSAIVVVHGDSEYQIVRYVKSKLHLNLYIHKRKTSIQINGLLKELDSAYNNLSSMRRNRNLSLEIEKNKIKNLKIFTIMDTDDCDEKTKKKYINKSLFDSFWLRDDVVPIYNIISLEEVLYQCKIIDKIYTDKEKMRNYPLKFPVSASPLVTSSIEDIKELSRKLSTCKNTNMNVFLDYCIELAQGQIVNNT